MNLQNAETKQSVIRFRFAQRLGLFFRKFFCVPGSVFIFSVLLFSAGTVQPLTASETTRRGSPWVGRITKVFINVDTVFITCEGIEFDIVKTTPNYNALVSFALLAYTNQWTIALNTTGDGTAVSYLSTWD